MNPSRQQTPGIDQQAEPYCGLIRLLLVMLYDAFAVFAILMIAGAIALLLPFNNPSAGQNPVYTLYLLCPWFLYLAWCWRNGGVTLGMRAWRVMIVSDRGSSLTWRQCGLRFLVAWVSAAAAGMGYVWMLFDREHLSWHDRLSHTRLVLLKKPLAVVASDSPTQVVDSSKTE